MRVYRAENPCPPQPNRTEYHAQHYRDNRERLLEQGRAWKKANPEAVKRTSVLRKWRDNGVNPWPYASREELHDKRYIVATHCETCTRAFDSIKSKINPRRMEHDHRPPYLFRAICCSRCNNSRRYWDARILPVHEELVSQL